MIDTNDYVSNPKSPKWNDGSYPVLVIVKYTTVKGTKFTPMKFRSYEMAQIIIRLWNEMESEGLYELANKSEVEDGKIS